MNRLDRRARALAIGLAAVAGFVDASAFIQLGGFFVSFMSGNSTRLGVGLAEAAMNAAIAGGLIAAFVGGAMLGSLLGHRGGGARRAVVAGAVALVLALATLLLQAGFLFGGGVAMAIAMGAENAIFEEDGEVRIGLTYMTGSLVKLGQRLAAALRGGDPWDWVPYLLHWLGLVAGATAGALAVLQLGATALWIAVAAMLALAIAARATV